MSELGQKRKCPGSRGTSVLPSGADIVSLPRHVRLVPTRDSCTAAKYHRYSITSSARASTVGESVRPSRAAAFRFITISNTVACLNRKLARCFSVQDPVEVLGSALKQNARKLKAREGFYPKSCCDGRRKVRYYQNQTPSGPRPRFADVSLCRVIVDDEPPQSRCARHCTVGSRPPS